jgi:predicted ATP-grasp superfamily ATP-dependent carboligase
VPRPVERQTPPLLIVARSARLLAQLARRAGYRPFVIDQFADSDTRSAAHAWAQVATTRGGDLAPRATVAAIARMLHEFGSMPIVCGSGFERQTHLLARLERSYVTLGTPSAVYARLLDLPDILRRLAARGVASPEVRTSPPRGSRDWLCKRRGGSGGWHVRVWDGAGAGSEEYFQRRVVGCSVSALYLTDSIRCRLVGMCEHLALRSGSPRPFRYAGACSQIEVPRGVASELTRAGLAVVRELGLRGLVGLDFIADGVHLQLVDINPRPTATLELFGDAIELFERHLRLCRGEALLYSNPQRRASRAHGVVYATRRWQVPFITWPTWIADRPMQGSVVRPGMPLCTVLAAGCTPQIARKRIERCWARSLRLFDGVAPTALA